MSEAPHMARFLLVHGACHGAWCWRDVLPPLAAAGHVAHAIDLPAAGLDPTPPETVTLEDCRDAVLSAIDAPVILVGHSLGGATVTAAAAAAPAKIAALVYLTGWAPNEGESARDLRARYGCDDLLSAMVMSADRKTSTFDAAALEGLFYHDCPPGTVDYARAHLTPQPTAPSTAPAAALPAGLPRHYIRCRADRAIPIDAQTDMTRDWPADCIHEMECGHSPFFAQPEKLAHILSKIAETP
ncbi:pimeloyl-ACP methyl ester carboxylesterase [Rhodovulum iodosum]|uniref:Pimeloyl-ACP methyl ester carboxylesterase n=1 Tax=Rhodovulum iodosum TaxID=68291 RepID=A0ABV3XWW8_9RHOB|nr:alpha/beta fold hydrolase [Rhodovulum robiginosum]RSK34100.1 alpha/beta fold hydrolase [Rhodovulum robiginosum]